MFEFHTAVTHTWVSWQIKNIIFDGMPTDLSTKMQDHNVTYNWNIT